MHRLRRSPAPQLLVAALETMHVGHLLDRALMPQLYFATNSFDAVDQVAIDEWTVFRFAAGPNRWIAVTAPALRRELREDRG